MARWVVVWGYATGDGYEVGVVGCDSIAEAERTAGRLRGVIVPAETVYELAEKIKKAAEYGGEW